MANATGLKIKFITLGAPGVPTIKVATNAGYTQNLEYIVKASIRSFNAIFIAQPGSAYPYLTKTWATITLYDDTIWSFELQDVDAGTHPTWVTGDEAGCVAFEVAVAAAL